MAAAAQSPNPMGTDGFEFVEYTALDAAQLRRVFDSIAALPPSRGIAPRMSRFTARARSISSSTPSRKASLKPSRASMGRSAPWHFAPRPRSARAPCRWVQGCRVGLRPDGAQHPFDRGDRRQSHLSRGPLWRPHHLRRRFPCCPAPIPHPRASAFSRSTTTHTSIAAAWTSGRASTRRSSASVRSATSISRAHTRLTWAMTSPCGKIRIPINESADDKSQIAEYLGSPSRRGHPAHRARHALSTRRSRPAARGKSNSCRCPTPIARRSA